MKADNTTTTFALRTERSYAEHPPLWHEAA